MLSEFIYGRATRVYYALVCLRVYVRVCKSAWRLTRDPLDIGNRIDIERRGIHLFFFSFFLSPREKQSVDIDSSSDSYFLRSGSRVQTYPCNDPRGHRSARRPVHRRQGLHHSQQRMLERGLHLLRRIRGDQRQAGMFR